MGPRSFQFQITDPKMWSAPTKTEVPYNFYAIKFSPSSQTVEAAEAGQTPFRTPRTPEVERTFPALRSNSVSNFTKSGPLVWISIADIHTQHTHTHWLLYIRFRQHRYESFFWELLLPSYFYWKSTSLWWFTWWAPALLPMIRIE